jgi:BirA family transcriptional regulator, biotin operon repressor / biotin---[acetyl-CoA-carboxylase] ligase
VDQLTADELRSELADAVIGSQVIVLEQTTSTNDAILQVASLQGGTLSHGRRGFAEGGNRTPVQEGLVMFAERQTAGRGQRGNRWESTAGKGLWFSILLLPEIDLSDSGRLTIWAIETVADVIRTQCGLDPVIKLPNDVQLDGRKVAGVLVEMRAQNKASHIAVIGIGINVNQCHEDFPLSLRDRATSIAMVARRRIDRQKFARALLRNLDLTYREEFVCSRGR